MIRRLGAVLAMVAAGLVLTAPATVEIAVPPPPPAAPALPIVPPTAEEVSARIAPAVVTLTANRGWRGISGTGIVLTADGTVLTNHHVVTGATDISAVSPHTGASYDVAVLGYDSTLDIAVLQLGSAAGLPVAAVTETPLPQPGSPVTAFGNADGGGVVVPAPGTIVAVDKTVSVRDSMDGSLRRLRGMLQVSAAIRPGDSGGPLVDAFGTVVGVNTAGAVEPDPAAVPDPPEAYAVPIGTALDVVDQVRTGTSAGTVHVGPTPLLGVSVTTDRTGNEETGAEVLWVGYGTPAAGTGLEIGDVIVAFDGRPVSTTVDLEDKLMARRPGDSVEIGWLDVTGRHRTARVVLDVGPPR
ncbi:S1C family serine protease [Rhodococcus ruber]|uniref:S1C family serine protease n=1 Tax=Rhodococcus ruber TaxID=1830 RepID=UPI002657F94C|nr:S1C family serine protease [Rhodococcus ruber]WKK12189.1 S1C family serine protease [Rhodococcus ruber]